MKMLPRNKKTTASITMRILYVIATACFCLVLVDSYVPPHERKSLPKRMPFSLSVSSSKSMPDSITTARQKNSGSSSDPSYIQWSQQKDTWKMQTAVTTFHRGDQTVELHAQQHFGDADYFRYWNSEQDFNVRHDCVLFELLVDDALLAYQRGDWRVTQPIMASTNDQMFAQNLGLQCQASIIDYTNRKWAHADLSRQEFVKLATKSKGGTESDDDRNTPLWKLASLDSSSTAAEAVAAFLNGPPTLAYSSRNPRNRRLFTNLFLSGGRLAFALRAVLWLTVPAPELSIILLDWSSLLQGGSNPNALSDVALPILTSLVKFNIDQMRRFLYGQVVLSSKDSGSESGGDASSSWSLLVIDRNDHAMNVLRAKLEEKSMKSVALLYGSSHCPDLHNKIVAMGFQPMKTEWRTVWSVQESNSDVANGNETGASRGLPAVGIALLLYLIVGALDWVGIVGDTSSLLLDFKFLDASVEVGAYLVRHVLLYLGLSKFLIDWTNSSR